MGYCETYRRWLERVDDAALLQDLAAIETDDNEIRERFGIELLFGTAGLRGIMGAGAARMNRYTVCRATQGLANYILARYGGGAVAISYDSRNYSQTFAQASAAVLAANGITAYLYDRLMPTPMLSFAVRELRTQAGIMITASHNPAAYNGYKVYGPDGCQMTDADTLAVFEQIEAVDIFDDVVSMDFDAGLQAGLIRYIDETIVERFYEAVKAQQVNPGVCRSAPAKVLYSPLHGTGLEPVCRILSDVGVADLELVAAQTQPDGNFPTCPYPNPETKEALQLGLAQCAVGNPDLFLATDPDADRVGVVLPDGGDYRILSGNEVGVLLLHYIIEARKARGTMPDHPVAVRSIVSTPLADEIARDGGVEMIAVLTGFKYIGEQILLLEQKGEQERFLFGFEESCGYMAGSYVRDKDAVVTCMLLCEMASYYRSKDVTLAQVLDSIYQTYGYYRNGVLNIQFEGIEGHAQMQAVMARLFANHPEEIGGVSVVAVADYRNRTQFDKRTGERLPIHLPQSDVIAFTLENGATVIIRPSGTEPKMKVYLTAKEAAAEQSAALIERLSIAAKKLLGQ